MFKAAPLAISARILLLVALFFGLAPLCAVAQSANQLMNYNQMQSAITAGNLIKVNGSCNFNGTTVTTRAIFVLCIGNNGSCAGSSAPSTYMMTYGDMLNCKSGGSVSQQSTNATFSGVSAFNDDHGACHQGGAVSSYTTTNAVAPTSAGTQVEWDGAGSNGAFTLVIKKPDGTTGATYSVPANATGQYPYFAAGSPAGVYTVIESGLASYTCPSIGTGGRANGTLKWYQ